MSRMNWKKAAKDLWAIIDDIDTYSDVCKSNNDSFRHMVEQKQKERFKILESDGYQLFQPGTMPAPNRKPVKPYEAP